MNSEKDCKRILFNLGIKYGVSPNLLSKRLLDASDKQLMLDGELDLDVLEEFVIVWLKMGVPDLANGSSKILDMRYWYEHEKLKLHLSVN
jgi:hypothetical protein